MEILRGPRARCMAPARSAAPFVRAESARSHAFDAKARSRHQRTPHTDHAQRRCQRDAQRAGRLTTRSTPECQLDPRCRIHQSAEPVRAGFRRRAGLRRARQSVQPTGEVVARGRQYLRLSHRPHRRTLETQRGFRAQLSYYYQRWHGRRLSVRSDDRRPTTSPSTRPLNPPGDFTNPPLATQLYDSAVPAGVDSLSSAEYYTIQPMTTWIWQH